MTRYFSARVLNMFLFCLLLPSCLLFSGCDNKDQLRSQIQALEQQKQGVADTITKNQAAINELSQDLNVQIADDNEYQSRVQGYILDHKMAVAALGLGLGGGSVALDASNKYSEDAKQVGGIMAVGAAIWALANADEMSEVLKTLNTADATVKIKEAEIARTKSRIQEQQAILQNNQTQLAQFVQQITSLHQQLGA